MTNILSQDLTLLLPEISLVAIALIIQMLGLTRVGIKLICPLALLGIIWAIVSVLGVNPYPFSDLYAFNGSFISTMSHGIFKILVLAFGFLVTLSYVGFTESTNQEPKAEYITMLLLSLAGACIAIFAGNLIVLFMGLELQALIGYMLASFDRDNPKSSEAGLKYFVLGALASCLILLGMSFLYGFSGSIAYQDLAEANLTLGFMAGSVLLVSGLIFKMSIAPFHMWTPDVYEGSPIISVTFFASVQKMSILCVILTLTTFFLPSTELSPFIKVCAILSMIIGSIGGVRQRSIKRLMAYSTILNMGFVLIPLVTPDGVALDSLRYLIIYSVGTVGFFALLVSSLGVGADTATFSDLQGLAQKNKAKAALISVFIFSIIGLPPFAGFFAKYYVLSYAVENDEYLLAGVGLLASVIAAYYYLKIIKSMYFDETTSIVQASWNIPARLVVTLTACFTIFFWAI